MFNDDRPLDNPINWSFRMGRLWGVTIHIHVAFVLCAVILIWMELPQKDDPFASSIPRALLNGLGTYVILFTIVLLHEFGHCWGARREGGSADQILLWPLGGLAFTNPPHRWRAHLVTTVAGPAVNVVICGLTSVALAAWCGSLGAVPWNPLRPFAPVGDNVLYSEGQFWLASIYGVSYFLLLVNLLPIFPFDGGRIVQALLWRTRGFRASMEIATGTGMIGAIVLGLFALFSDADWILMGIAVFGYMTCWQTRRMMRESGDALFESYGEDMFARGYTFQDSDREAMPGPIARWRARRARIKQERAAKRQCDHEQAVEDILCKVSEQGLASLTPHERGILEQETQRKRSVQS